MAKRELSTLEHACLSTLAGQEVGYLCSPDSAAFISQGLEDAKQVDDCMKALHDEGFVDFYYDEEQTTVYKIEKDDDGNPKLDSNGSMIPVLRERKETRILDDGEEVEDTFYDFETEVVTHRVDSGWVITDKGRGVLAKQG